MSRLVPSLSILGKGEDGGVEVKQGVLVLRTMAPKVPEQTYWRPETQEAAWEPSGVTGKAKHSPVSFRL